jgi:lipopolysaccharide export system permease protein
VLPRANHRLKTLQDDIAQTKPTFLLKPQVINAVVEGKFYLKAGKIDQGSGNLKEVVIYDFGDPTRRRTIYADSGAIAMAGKDLELVLHHGQMHEVSTAKPNQLDRMFFDHDMYRIRDVAGEMKRSETDSTQRSDRELGVCQMQKRLRVAEGRYKEARRDYEEAVRRSKVPLSENSPPDAPSARIAAVPPEPGGIGGAYCALITRVFGVKAAEAAEPAAFALHALDGEQGVAGQGVQDTAKKPAQDTAKKPAQDTTKKPAQDTARKPAADTSNRAAAPAAQQPPAPPPQQPSMPQTAAPRPVPAQPVPGVPAQGEPRVLINGVLVDPRTGLPAPATPAPGMPGQPGVVLGTSTPPAPGTPGAMPVTPTPDSLKTPAQIAAEAMLSNKQQESNKNLFLSRTSETKLQLDMAEKTRNRFLIEINKKFSLAAACLIFVALGAPIALRFPRGGVGLVIGVSLVVFGGYYVGLIGGESLANKALMSPFWAMWGTNVILTVVAIVLLFRMGREENSGRGGDWGDRIDRIRSRLRIRDRRASLRKELA